MVVDGGETAVCAEELKHGVVLIFLFLRCCEDLVEEERRKGRVVYPVFAYATEYVLAPVTAFPVGSDYGVLQRLGRLVFVLDIKGGKMKSGMSLGRE